MISDLIKERAAFLGITNAQLAEIANTSQSQISAFFNKNASLTVTALDNIFDYLGIDLDTYENRRLLAQKAADVLLNHHYDVEYVKDMGRYSMASIVGDKRIEFFVDNLHDDEFDGFLTKDHIISVECTYAYFKTMVIQYMQLNGRKPTPKTVLTTFGAIGSTLGLGLFGSAGLLGLGAYAMYKYITNDDKDISKGNNPLINIAKKMLK